MAAEHLHDVPRPAEADVRADEDPLGARPHEAVDEVLREPEVDLARRLRRTLPPVEPRVVDVDVEPVLVGHVPRTERPPARTGEPTLGDLSEALVAVYGPITGSTVPPGSPGSPI